MRTTQSIVNEQRKQLRANSAAGKKAAKLTKTASEVSEKAESMMSKKFDGLKKQVSTAASSSVSLAKKYPFYTLAAIGAIGISVGLMLRNRSKSEL